MQLKTIWQVDMSNNSLEEKIIIYEDSTQALVLNEDENRFLENFRKEHESTYGEKLPFKMKRVKGTLYFEPSGCVGIIKTPNRTIVILPRFEVFNFNIILRMWVYARSTHQFDRTSQMPSYKFDYERFIPDIAEQFINSVDELVKIGLHGYYVNRSEELNKIKGKINLGKSLVSYNSVRTVNCEFEDFSTDNIMNQIILYCLNLVRRLQSEELNTKVDRLMSFFRAITLRSKVTFADFSLVWSKISRLNSYYGKTLRLCEILVFNSFISSIEGTTPWYGFLVDYNYLFEDYIRNLLMNHLGRNVTKWQTPKAFGTWSDGQTVKQKHYQPDILIDYNEDHDRCEFVIDVKNKPVYNVFSNEDVFQILFYSSMLQTNTGILVYPSSQIQQTSLLEVKFPDVNGSYRIFAVFNTLTEDSELFWTNQDKFIEEIKNLTSV